MYQTQTSFASLDFLHATYFLALPQPPAPDNFVHTLVLLLPGADQSLTIGMLGPSCGAPPCAANLTGNRQGMLAPFPTSRLGSTHPLRIWIWYPEWDPRGTQVIQWRRWRGGLVMPQGELCSRGTGDGREVTDSLPVLSSLVGYSKAQCPLQNVL